MQKTIALDAMGGDHGPSVVVPAAARVLKSFPDVRLIFVGKRDQLEPLLSEHASQYSDRFEIRHASEEIAMDESPSQALRSKKDSSMRVAINCVKEGRAQACVSAGNTGALMATARFVLKTLPGIDRPAIITAFPTKKEGETRILDLGANVDSSPEDLYQFAVMGSVLVSAAENIPSPKVGLLNVGEEEIKGNELVKKANDLFEQSNAINYIGYVEGDTIFDGVVDVVVCDGFAGNIMLKVCEGTAATIFQYLKEAFTEVWWTKLVAFLALPIFKRAYKRIDPERYNGATLIGLNGIVVKSHGSAKDVSFAYAIEEAIFETEKNIPQLIKEKVGSVLEESEQT